jgi:SAM-dependent methyltransferase
MLTRELKFFKRFIMTIENNLLELYERDKAVWDQCAEQYEESIVGGHPDIIAYEEFEEDLIDRLFIYLMRDCGRDIHFYDVGCGSARLHLHLGLKSIVADRVSEGDAKLIRAERMKHARHSFDPVFNNHLKLIGGLDFSREMIAIATKKLKDAGLSSELGSRLYLEQGSAFELDPIEGDYLPFAVAVCNSIGVMQGPEGAQQLFKNMRTAVEKRGGIALISCYRRKAIKSHALGNYESTMNVSGQPEWLEPKSFADEKYLKVPRRFKRAHDPSCQIIVNIFDDSGKLLEKGVQLKRNDEAVEEMTRTGHIKMHSDYESNWYSTQTISKWIDQYWGASNSYHVMGEDLDSLRAEPVQLAIFDPDKKLETLFKHIIKS